MPRSSYFSFFEDVIVGDIKMKNIFARYTVSVGNSSNITLNYYNSNYEKMEVLASQFYSDVQYWWIIALLNNVQDYHYDWILKSNELTEWVDMSWSQLETSIQTQKYKNDKNNFYLDMYEKNEAKKNIKYLNPSYLQDFIYKMEQEYSKRVSKKNG